MPRGIIENSRKILSDVKKEIERDKNRFKSALTLGMRRISREATLEIRDEVAGVFSRRLANTWRNKTFPVHKTSFGPAGFVYNQAPHIVSAFENGVVIKGREKKYLAIPTPAAQRKVGGKRLTPELWNQLGFPELRFVARPGKNALLVVDGSVSESGKQFRGGKPFKKGGSATFVAFVLVYSVTIKKRLNSLQIVEKHYNKFSEVVDSILNANK
jgi:hypothetical protein